jgi:hypothetical protein
MNDGTGGKIKSPMTGLLVASQEVGEPPCNKPSCSPPTEEERARMTLKAMMDTCSLATSDMPEGFFRYVKFGEMIWKAFELGRIYEKNRIKDENE